MMSLKATIPACFCRRIGDNTGTELIVTSGAAKALTAKAMPRRDATALQRKLQQFAAAPFAPHPWAKPLQGRPDVVRVRQGDWRAVCRIDEDTGEVVVDAIGHRREVYR